MLALVPVPVVLANDSPSDGISGRPANCDLYLELAGSAGPSQERSYALRALRECAPDPGIARSLEAALLSDDFAARAVALASLDRHLNPGSVPVLLTLLDRETPHSRQAERVARIYRYLSRLAGPATHTEPANPGNEIAGQIVPVYLFVEGLDDTDVRIREASLLGLGRSGLASTAWPLLYRTLLAPRTVRDHVAALQASRILSSRSDSQALRAAGLTLDLLVRRLSRRPAGNQDIQATPALLAAYAAASRHELAQAERAVLELLGDLRGLRSLEQLLRYRLQADFSGTTAAHGTKNANHNRLQALITARLRGLPNTLGQPAHSLRNLRVYERPTETSSALGVLAKNSILYITDATTPGYRLPPLRGAAKPEANWLKITTLNGLAGWAHASRVQRIVPPGQ